MIDKFMHGFLDRVYDLEDYTQLEINSKLIQKIEEVIENCNNTFEFVEWLKEQGVPDEVQNILFTWKEDGTIKNLLGNLIEELKEKVEETNEKLTNENETIKAHLNNIATIPSGINIANEINTLVNNGVKCIKIPKGRYYVSEPIKLGTGVQLMGDKGSVLYTDKDITIITTKDDDINYDDIYLYGLNVTQEYSGPTSFPVINLKNANMCRVERVHCYISNSSIRSESGLKVYSTLTNAENHAGIYSILIDKCDFRNCGVDINITDSYITNTNIWGVNRKYALHLGKSSQQVNNCQFVGGDQKGAVWIEDIDDEYDIEIIKITNCYFDGSYSDVKSGIGLNAKKMRYSNISNSSFWYQKKDGMVLDGCFSNTFVGLTFEGSGRNNLTESNLNDINGYADIKIKNLTYDNIFSDIIFTANGSYHIKNKAIQGINTNTFENHYNYLTNLSILDFDKYDTNAFDFSFPYVGTNIKGTEFKQNNINGTVKIEGELQATTGFKTSVLFSHNAVVGEINEYLSPNGQTKKNYLVCNNGCLLDIGVNVETGVTSGSLTLQVFRNDDLIAEETMDSTNPYFKIANYNYGDKKIYRGDLLKVKLITTDNLNNCNYLTATINISQ